MRAVVLNCSHHVIGDHGHEWAHDTAKTMAHVLHSTAKALAASPIPPRS
ncbi:hypothetical protein [Actinokineospora terrae]|uniref:Uncharacterized protein n=1 Tax=Actinokineospora terrae TaxID=155974 RepID=A0A1H9NZ27_9PSEU|nr:hypothetical protein [Actinokineospora terrae]SER41236.1 hypothetical protein SAMN04487818_103212 [Actinokineospora terrae]